MGDEASGSDSDISLSVIYLRAVLLAKMCKRLHRLVCRLTLKKQNKGKQTKVEEFAVKFIRSVLEIYIFKQTNILWF